MRSRVWESGGLVLAGTLLAVLASSCGSKSPNILVKNQLPTISLSARPERGDSVFYSVRLQWFASDPDGQVTHVIYAIDPPAEGDTAWVTSERNEATIFFRSHEPDSASIVIGSTGFPPTTVTSRDYHVFVIKAVDNEGAVSPYAYDAFTSETVAPQTQILDPPTSRLTIAPTAPSVTISWTGRDEDGVLSQKPIKYKYKLASENVILVALGVSTLGQADLQKFFSQEAPNFASWDSLPPDSTFKRFEGLTPGQIWYFAVVAFDEAGAYEPRFNLDNNLLRFKPGTQLRPPKLCVFNSFFARCQSVGSFDLSEERVVRLEVPADEPIPFFWEATIGVSGTTVAGYRWVLDPIDGDIFNETQRERDDQTYRWSTWSLNEVSATVGPFSADEGNVFHRFYVEARDNVSATTILIVEMKVVKPTFEKSLIVFDDFRGNPDRGPNFLPYASFPTEAVLDTLLYAVGGMPYQHRPPGTLSSPGVFAGFDYDTVDYRFTVTAGLPLSTLAHYKNLVWYADLNDAGRTGSKFSSSPKGALFFANTAGELNTLAVYLSQSRSQNEGNVWLFGSGIMLSIGNGYATRFGSSPAPYPLMSGGNRPDLSHILWPGDFLYDYMKIRSQVDIINQAGAGNNLDIDDNLLYMIPYLPQFHTPGAPWPPEGWTGGRGPDDDPRVGPASAANLAKWDGLPKLSITTEFPDWPSPLPSSIDNIPYVSVANSILETFSQDTTGGRPPSVTVSTLDTLYLYRTIDRGYKIRASRDWPDGKPVWFHYSGWDYGTAPHGQVNWTSAPIWVFERTQLQVVADKILAQFGLTRSRDRRTWTGPGSVVTDRVGVRESP